jgi:hypothetical protein
MVPRSDDHRSVTLAPAEALVSVPPGSAQPGSSGLPGRAVFLVVSAVASLLIASAPDTACSQPRATLGLLSVTTKRKRAPRSAVRGYHSVNANIDPQSQDAAGKAATLPSEVFEVNASHSRLTGAMR